jgi:hypothetical protein
MTVSHEDTPLVMWRERQMYLPFPPTKWYERLQCKAHASFTAEMQSTLLSQPACMSPLPLLPWTRYRHRHGLGTTLPRPRLD